MHRHGKWEQFRVLQLPRAHRLVHEDGLVVPHGSVRRDEPYGLAGGHLPYALVAGDGADDGSGVEERRVVEAQGNGEAVHDHHNLQGETQARRSQEAL